MIQIQNVLTKIYLFAMLGEEREAGQIGLRRGDIGRGDGEVRVRFIIMAGHNLNLRKGRFTELNLIPPSFETLIKSFDLLQNVFYKRGVGGGG